jgi:hypothetical protein
MTLSRWAQSEAHRLAVRATLQVVFPHVVTLALRPLSNPQPFDHIRLTDTTESVGRIQAATRVSPSSLLARMVGWKLQSTPATSADGRCGSWQESAWIHRQEEEFP